MSLPDGAVVAVEGLIRRFRRGRETVTALDDVTLALYPGELTAVAGPSGSGKTTLLSVLAGLDSPDGGRISTGPPLPPGVPPDGLGWRHLAFVPQSLALLDELTVYENVDLPARLDPAATPADWSTGEILDRLEIAALAVRYPSLISGGEQQRTALGRALRLRPPLLLADEPTGHQDRGRVELVLDVLRRHAYGGHAVLISTHDEAVIATADRVVMMADGRVVDDSRAGAALR
ncbi:ABC transporter ATP-binding protein [Planosporangium sp. 12N6]|uniref:ABC transporter ATP-binding protein n=1 Tax=Planosporangium spinosum TaxID=3402278 RepID=UPI003CE9E3F9